MSVPRRTAVGEQPQYSKLEPLTFQDLCKEILQASPDFRNVQVYGRPGQMQRGIDILAERLSPSGLTVGQCKRFQTFTDSQLGGAVKEFVKYKEYWKRQGVDTFILFISCDTSDTKVQSEFVRQRRRLQKSGIALELWSDSTITKHLRSNAGLVSTYLGGDWPTILCGGSVYVAQMAFPNTTNLLFTQLEQVSALHSDAVERAIESAREA
ncbi:restriction endonuclease [Edaphobacter paludis]|uniref:Restriction endonuclease n=1 Tax=Edaphobacter paludis TaxID=3035702 RepID=A0AAU7DAM6_9BACT